MKWAKLHSAALINCKEVEETEEFKYLGVWMDAKMKGSKYMEKK